MEKAYFFISERKFTIGGVNSMSKTDRVIELDFFQLANDCSLLSLLHLYYMNGNYGAFYTYETRAEWFAGYISSLTRTEKSDERLNYLESNPRIRIVIQDDSIFTKYQEKTGLDLRVIYS
jgi:hypothetical protein